MDFYRKYYHSIANPRLNNNVIVKVHENWSGSSALTAVTFESEMASRYLEDLIYAFKVFNKAAQIGSLVEVSNDTILSGCFCIPAPDRITWTSTPRPIIADLVNHAALPPRFLDGLDGAIRARHRPLTSVEISLASFERLRSRGEVEPAIIGIIATLESVLRESLKIKRGTLNEMLRNPIFSFLDANDISKINALRQARNKIAHGHSLANPLDGEQKPSTGAGEFDSTELNILCVEGLSAIRKIFREINLTFSGKFPH